MNLKDHFRYLVGGYYGVALMDEYPLKEYVMKDIHDFIQNFISLNPTDAFSYEEETISVKETVSDKVKLQDALLVLNHMNGPMDLVFLIKERLRKLLKSEKNL